MDVSEAVKKFDNENVKWSSQMVCSNIGILPQLFPSSCSSYEVFNSDIYWIVDRGDILNLDYATIDNVY